MLKTGKRYVAGDGKEKTFKESKRSGAGANMSNMKPGLVLR